MSIEWMTHVWDNSKHNGSRLLMLLAIADYSNEVGQAYPSIETLAERTRQTVRNAVRIIEKLELSGEIHSAKYASPYGTNLYTLKVSTAQKTKRKSSKRSSDILGSESPSTSDIPVPQMSHDPSLTIIKPPEGKEGADKPRSDSQHPAIQMYRLKAKTYPDKAQFDTIIQAVGESGDHLDFWGEVVKAYIDLGWNKRNIGNMVSYFQRHELPVLNGKARLNSHAVDWQAALNESIARHNGNL